MPFALGLLAFFVWLLINGRAAEYLAFATTSADNRTLHMSIKTSSEL